jgi:predicted RNase H-like nuclease
MLAAGVDGCRKGWICVVRDLESGSLRSRAYVTARELIFQDPSPNVFAIDVPIGLLDAGARPCDAEACRVLGPRASSVFSAPLRSMLRARSWEEACQIRVAIEQKRITKQAWGILPKIREIDELLADTTGVPRQIIREVHPEVCFWAWKGEPMTFPKKTASGREERRVLIDEHFGSSAFPEVRCLYRRDEVADDDILDAFAALRTAERILSGDADRLPRNPACDARGIPMEMVF